MKDRIFLGVFIAGLLFTAAVGMFSLVMELRLPSGYQLAAEEYHDLNLLNEFMQRLRDVRRAGLNYLILLDDQYLADFEQSDAALRETMQQIREQMETLGEPEDIEAVLAEAESYVIEFRQAVGRALGLNAEEALRQIRDLVGTATLDQLLDGIMELEQQNYLAFTRYSSEVSEAAKRSLRAITLFLIAAFGLIAVSGIMLLRAYRRNKALLAEAHALKVRLEEKNRELESFIRIVGHDLKAPLINIKGFSDEIIESHRQLDTMIGSLPVPPETAKSMDGILRRDVPESLHFISSSVDTLHRLITTMVKAAKAGQLPVEPVEIDANRLMGEIVKDFDYRIKEAGARVHIETLPGCVGDVDQVRQVFSNVLDNAIKYRNPDRPLEVRVKGEIRERMSGYCFEDNGIGIAPEEVGRVFDLYFQIKRKEMAGDGIGLATVRKMLENNGGRIEVESEVNRGSRFWVWLPAK